jgi:TonB family protein
MRGANRGKKEMCKKSCFWLLTLGIFIFSGTSLRADDRKAVKASPPRYPALASRMRVQGKVKLKATVESDGSVSDVKVVSGHNLLAGVAANAVKDWKYEPAKEKSNQDVTFDFALSH